MAVAAVYAKQLRIPESPPALIAVWVLCLMLAFVSSIYLYHLHQAHRLNKRFAEQAERAIILNCGESAVFKLLDDPETKRRSADGSDWSLKWQVFVVLLFAIVTALLLTVAPTLSTRITSR